MRGSAMFFSLEKPQEYARLVLYIPDTVYIHPYILRTTVLSDIYDIEAGVALVRLIVVRLSMAYSIPRACHGIREVGLLD